MSHRAGSVRHQDRMQWASVLGSRETSASPSLFVSVDEK